MNFILETFFSTNKKTLLMESRNSTLTLQVRIPFRPDVLDTTLCDKVCQWFSPGTPVSSTNKTDHRNITEILLKVALNTINQTNQT
jgi:hypothetical protein